MVRTEGHSGGNGGISVIIVGNVAVVAVVTSRFLSHLQHLAVVKVRKPLTPTLPPKHQGKGEMQEVYRYDRGFEKEMGYILEEHLVTLWRSWR